MQIKRGIRSCCNLLRWVKNEHNIWNLSQNVESVDGISKAIAH